MAVHQPTKSVLVSVIVPLYNAERFITSAIASILAAKDIELEVVVVDDGCTDASLKRVDQIADPRVRVIRNSGKGIAAAMNSGLAAARGEIIMRCDADDLYPPNRLKTHANWLVNNPDYGAICGNYSAVGSRGELVIQFNCGEVAEEITHELQNGITRTHLCTYAIRKQVLSDLNGFRDYFVTGEDIDLQLRLGEVTKVWYGPSTSYHYRLHAESITHTLGSDEREFFDAIARIYQKQRQLEGADDLQRGCPVPVPPGQGKPPLTAAEHIQGLLIGRAWKKHADGDRLNAILTGFRSALIQPQNLEVWRCLLALAIK